jgi:signal transduction histidine kinase
MVVATVDLTPYERAEQRSLWITIAFGVLAVLLAGVVAQQVGRYALAAVHRMSARADEWQEHDPEHRFGLGEPVDEITELGRTLDRLLDRIGTALASERRLTDEIAHELRTPLTAIRAEAQLAQLGGESAEAIVAATDRLEASIKTLLDAARARDLGESGCDLVAALEPMVRGVGAFEAPSGPLPVRAGVELVRGLVGPLLDNARGHARGELAVRVSSSSATEVTVQVVDDGPGVSAEQAAWIFEPGRSGRGGTGLGLAVVRRLAASAQAEVRAVPGDHGVFELTLPRA